MDEREFTVILSDIHIGTNSPTVLYHKEIHEKYLVAILDDIIASANQIREVILLGDIFEFWSYSPDEIPPTIDDIILFNPGILGPMGKLSQALTALKGRIVFIPGNHDLNVTESDLSKIKNPLGYKIHYQDSFYRPAYDTGMFLTHGHEFTLFNAPYYHNKLSPLPIGYFVSRALAYQIKKDIQNGANLVVTNIIDYTNPILSKLLLNIQQFLTDYAFKSYFVSAFIDAIIYVTGIPSNLPIRINESTFVTLNDVKLLYKDLSFEFYEKIAKLKITDSNILMNILLSDINSTSLFECVKQYALNNEVNRIFMGHTHEPMVQRIESLEYINTGFMCPSKKDMFKRPITYGIYSLSNRYSSIMKIT